MKVGMSTLTVEVAVITVLKFAISPAKVGGPAGVQFAGVDQFAGVVAVFQV